MGNWRDEIDPLIREHLETLIAESVRHRKAYKNAKNTANAQLWCISAVLQKQIVDLSMKIKFLEKALKEMGTPKKKGSIDAAKALKDVLRKL